jgi:ribonuclease P protein component
VTRHLLRRQIYAVAQDFAAQLPPNGAYVVRLRAAFDPKRFVSASSEPLRQAVRSELQQLFGYAVRKLGGAGPAAAANLAAPGVLA